jgi:adenosylcobinamide-GDP ribazoletransferase
MTRLGEELHAFGNAVMFFTRLRVPRRLRWSEDLMQRATAWYPAVGALVGAIAAAVAWIALQIFPGALIAAVACTLATILVTGGFHEDGLADTCDAMFGATEPTRVLEIMKDSRIGSFGALGLITVVGLKIALLSVLLQSASWNRVGHGVLVLIVGHSVSRGASVSVLRLLSYVRANDSVGAKSKPMGTKISRPRLGYALATAAIPVAVLVSPRRIPMLVGLTALTTVSMAVWFRRRIGGYTGDCLGAVQQITEIVVLGVLAAEVSSWS